MGRLEDAAKEEAKNLSKKAGKKLAKKIMLVLAKPLIIILILVTVLMSFIGIWSSVTDTLKDMLSQLASYSTSVWKYLTDDYWVDIENKDLERQVRESDGTIATVKVSIVEAYLLDLEEKGISVKDLYLLGDGEYKNPDTGKEKTVWELLKENSENTKLIKKYVAEFIRADFITNQIHRRRGNELVNPNNENEIDGGIYLYRTKNEEKDGNVSKTDKNIYQMEYTEYQKFLEYYQSTGTYFVPSNIEKYFAIAEEDGQLGDIAYSEGDLLYYKVDTKEVTYEKYKEQGSYEKRTDLTLQTEDYQALIAEYSMPYEFLIALCQYTQNPEYVYHVARLARKTRIDLLIQDSMTTTIREEITTADVEKVLRRENQDPTTTSLGNLQIEKIRTVEVVDTPQLIISKVNTWSAAMWNRYMNINETTDHNDTQTISEIRVIYNTTYTVGDSVASDYAAASDSTTRIHEMHRAKGIVKATTEQITTNRFVQIPGVDKIRKSKQFLGLLRNDTGECSNNCFEYKELAQICADEAVFVRDGQDVFYQIPNATREEAPYHNMQHAEEALCAQLQLTYSASNDESENQAYNEKLQGVEEYIRYVLRLPDNEEVDLEEDEDWEDLLPDETDEGIQEVESLIVKTDEEGALPAVTKEELEKIINVKYSGKKKENAISILDTLIECQDEYNVNAVFILAVAQQETSVGTADTSYVKQNNWLSWNLGQDFESPQRNVEIVMYNIKNGTIYFTQGKITIHDIGHTYCPNTEDYPNQGDNWVANVTSTVISMYKAIDVDIVVDQSGEGGSFEPGDEGKGYSGIYTSSSGMSYYEYKQFSPAPWGDNTFMGGTMGDSGCSITSIAIILTGYGIDITPEDLRQKYPGGAALQEILASYGVGSDRKSSKVTSDEVIEHLKTGKPIIMYLENGTDNYWTKKHHFLTLLDWREENGKQQVYVSNPGKNASHFNGWYDVDKVVSYDYVGGAGGSIFVN